MNPSKVRRENTKSLTDLPNIGKAMAADLHLIGIESPNQLAGESAYSMYEQLCEVTGHRHDPCVIDVFLSIINFVNGGEPQVWWAYTNERKNTLSEGKSNER